MKQNLVKAFNEMESTINTIATLHKKKLGYESYLEAFKAIDEVEKKYMSMVSSMLFFELITEEDHSEAYSWLMNMERPTLY